MHLIQKLKYRFLFLCLCVAGANASAQSYLELSYNPGISNIFPGPNARPSLQNAGVNVVFPSIQGNVGFVTGVHLINRGTGARVAFYGPTGNFIEYRRSSANFFFAHIPVGVWFKHQNIYIMTCLAIDRFLEYNEKDGGIVIPSNRPFWLRNTYLSTRVEGGYNTAISSMVSFKLGLYFSNTFSGGSGNPFMNFGLSGGFLFRLDRKDVEEEDYEDVY